MTDMPSRPRKRSAVAGLTAAGALAMLSACDAADAPPEPQTEVAAFSNAGECKASGQFAAITCDQAADAAAAQDGKTAPRFEGQSLCEDQFGAGNCVARTENGTGFFVPLLTGFMIGRLLDGGGGYRYSGLYQDRRDGRYYSGTGAWLSGSGYGGRPYGYSISRRAIATPVTTQRSLPRSSVVSRGGFGGRVSARSGGWGGGRSFGG